MVFDVGGGAVGIPGIPGRELFWKLAIPNIINIYILELIHNIYNYFYYHSNNNKKKKKKKKIKIKNKIKYINETNNKN